MAGQPISVILLVISILAFITGMLIAFISKGQVPVALTAGLIGGGFLGIGIFGTWVVK